MNSPAVEVVIVIVFCKMVALTAPVKVENVLPSTCPSDDVDSSQPVKIALPSVIVAGLSTDCDDQNSVGLPPGLMLSIPPGLRSASTPPGINQLPPGNFSPNCPPGHWMAASMLPPGTWDAGSVLIGDASAPPPGVWNQPVPPGVWEEGLKRSSSKESLLSTDVASSSEDDGDTEVQA